MKFHKQTCIHTHRATNVASHVVKTEQKLQVLNNNDNYDYRRDTRLLNAQYPYINFIYVYILTDKHTK